MRVDIHCGLIGADTTIHIDGQPALNVVSFEVRGLSPDERTTLILVCEPDEIHVDGDMEVERHDP